MRINEIITESAELEEGWKSKVGAAALAGLGLLGAGGASAAGVHDPSWSTAGYDSHIKADSSLTKKTSSDGVSAPKTSKDLQSRISDVTGPNAEGQYRVTVTQNGNIASQYVTKTPPPGWLVKESAELEEGWKSKLGAAALAGAAALGGGPADAGGGIPLTVVGKSYDYHGNTIVKYQDGSTRNLGTNVWTQPTMAQQRQNQALAKQKADREAAARASRQANYAQKNMPQQRNSELKFDPTQDPFLMDVTDQINKDIGKFKSNLESNPTASEKNNVIKQIDSRIKYYSDYIKDVKASRGVSSEENAYLVNKIQGLATLKAATSSKYGDTVVGQAKPLSAQDQKFYDSFDADLTKVSRTLDQIRASKPTREKMEAARQDLARVIPQYDSTLNQAISRGFDKAAGQTFKLKIDNLKRIAGIPLNQK